MIDTPVLAVKSAERLQQQGAAIPMGRLGLPNHIAPAPLFLAATAWVDVSCRGGGGWRQSA